MPAVWALLTLLAPPSMATGWAPLPSLTTPSPTHNHYAQVNCGFEIVRDMWGLGLGSVFVIKCSVFLCKKLTDNNASSKRKVHSVLLQETVPQLVQHQPWWVGSARFARSALCVRRVGSAAVLVRRSPLQQGSSNVPACVCVLFFFFSFWTKPKAITLTGWPKLPK